MSSTANPQDGVPESGYTVKQVAAMTGVLDTTLRAWERRYSIVAPKRSAGGYRLYSEEQVATLRAMAGLVAQGVPASVAARSLAEEQSNAANRQRRGADAESDESPDDVERKVHDLVAAALTLDQEHLDELLNAAFKAAEVDRVADDWLLPQLERLGRAWETRTASVAHEHFASEGVTRMLGQLFDASGAEQATAGPVLVGLSEDSQHTMGLHSFAVCLRRLGVEVIYLGADVPVDDWVVAAKERRPRAAVVGVPLSSRVNRAQEVVDRLSEVTPPITVWVGGGKSGSIERALTLPSAVAEAAEKVALSLRAGGSPTA